ncbi:MAG: chaperone modulator CbpM [Candidatus Contubernalis sp.]|nr:chaperone modulator CbpM [Candidatus Contubernalis sp.]
MKKYQLEIFCFEAKIWDEDYNWVDLTQLGLPEGLIRKMSEMGIVEMRNNCVRSDQIARIYKAMRLRQNLGINLAGAGVILDLMEEMESLREEIKRLKREFL